MLAATENWKSWIGAVTIFLKFVEESIYAFDLNSIIKRIKHTYFETGIDIKFNPPSKNKRKHCSWDLVFYKLLYSFFPDRWLQAAFLQVSL